MKCTDKKCAHQKCAKRRDRDHADVIRDLAHPEPEKTRRPAPREPKKTPHGLTDDQVAEFQRAGWQTWEAIAGDCLSAFAEGGKGNRTMSRAAVIEVVLDADRMTMFGGMKDPAVIAFYRDGDYEQMKALMRKRFRDSRYC